MTLRGALRFGVANLKELTGAEERFCIRGAYRHRARYHYFDDTEMTDEWQNEVYQRAIELARSHNVKTVYDIGCGSGFKLMKYFAQYDTTGFDVPDTLPFLQQTYPDRKWRSVSLSDRTVPRADLVICSDVIEHVLDPVELLDFIRAVSAKWVVISTPDRDLIYPRFSAYRLGPPRNPSHIREWSFREFGRLVNQHFEVKEHFISNREQWTQMIVATV